MKPREAGMRVVANALMFHHDNQKITSLSDAPEGINWLLHLTRKFSRKIKEIARPPELYKADKQS